MITPKRIVVGGIAIGAVLIAAVFAYGYWRTVTHAVLYVEVSETSGRAVSHPDAEVTFIDGGGRVLAQYTTDDMSATSFFISTPAAHSCRAIEKRASFEVGGHEAYRQCFNRQSRWIMGWIRDVSSVDVRVGECRWKSRPVAVTEEETGPSDWWLLWPTPHAGGSPITVFHAAVIVDAAECVAGPTPPSSI